MAGMLHTAESFATGMRNLRDRLPSAWMAKGNEWANLPTLYIRWGQELACTCITSMITAAFCCAVLTSNHLA
jgi:hypothetical protein